MKLNMKRTLFVNSNNNNNFVSGLLEPIYPYCLLWTNYRIRMENKNLQNM